MQPLSHQNRTIQAWDSAVSNIPYSYDQFTLAKLLAVFENNWYENNEHANKKHPAKLEMVTLNHFPGAARFIGMGQLPPEAIRLIWQQRQLITQQQLDIGKIISPALGEPTPLPLYEIYKSKDIKHLPHMKGALLGLPIYDEL